MTMRIFVTGGRGVLATALREFLPDAVYLIRGHARNSTPDALDVTDDARFDIQMRAAIVTHGVPAAIIHAAAITDHATPDARALIDVNVRGTERVARWCRAYGVGLTYLSTHYVYPGTRGRYRETDALRPIGAYAMSKLAGESWAATVPRALIVRGSWYTYETRLKGWLDRGAFGDAWCSRESARDAARKIAQLTVGLAEGTYNIGAPRRTFAQILHDEGYSGFAVRKRALATCAYPFPEDVSVDTSKFEAWTRARTPDARQLEFAFAEPALSH